MFWENFLNLCNKNETTPNGVAKKIGIASCSVTAWKNGSVPRDSTLLKIAEYFGVSVDFLTSEPQKEKPTEDGELSDFEKKAVEMLRSVPEEQKSVVLAMLRAALGLQ